MGVLSYQDCIYRYNESDIISADKIQRLFDEMMDEAYGNVKIMGQSFSAIYALSVLDKYAYEQTFSEWLDWEIRDHELVELECGSYIYYCNLTEIDNSLSELPE